MIMKRIIVKGPDFCAVTENGILVEYVPVNNGEQSGAILLGRTDRLMPGMNSAFVDIGRKKSGFLPLDENSGSFTGEKIRSGETMILQVKKEETGGKGAFLTRDITLAGSLTILMPMNRYIGVSSRVKDPEIRKTLKKTGEKISSGRFGLVIRSAAEEADEEAMTLEAESLYQVWQRIKDNAVLGGKPGTLLFSDDPAERLREDYAAGGIDGITEVNEPDPEIRRQLHQAGERTVRLPGGGNIVIDRCEAMTVIDVNTASTLTRGTKERTVLETNLEACDAIAQQVRLRNLSGIILIDFIDMDTETDQSLVEKRLSECFASDRIKTVIHGWTSLGIMEMTRKRTRAANSFNEK